LPAEPSVPEAVDDGTNEDLDDETGEADPEWYPLPTWLEEAWDELEAEESATSAAKARGWSMAIAKASRLPVPAAITEEVAERIVDRIEGRLADLDLGKDPRNQRAAIVRMSELILGDVEAGMTASMVRFWAEGLKAAGIAPGEMGLMPEKLQTLQDDQVLWQAYADLTQSVSQGVNDVMREGIAQNLSRREMAQRIQQVASNSATRAERIVRTESTRISNVARAEGYKHLAEQGDIVYDYHWRGPAYDGGSKVGGRSSEHCRVIKERFEQERQNNGRVSIEEAERIVATVAAELNGPRWVVRPWISHPQCRHTISAKPLLEG